MVDARTERLPDVAATHALAARLAADARPGDVIALVGDLGAGKTELTRGLVRALGSRAPVSSPSYLLLNVYPDGRLPVAHFDAYFMDGPDDIERAGLRDLVREGHLVVVEWGDRVADVLPPTTLWVRLEPGDGPGERTAHLTVGSECPAP